MTRAFDRLDPALQYQIAYGLGFDRLRPVQELTIDAVLDGANVVVLAPTAGGKTEAAFLPLLSLMLQENRSAPSVLYVTPIKALINNQEERLVRLTGLVGRRAFKWHGDVGASQRRRFLREPADVLLTTPESLEAMFISRRVDSASLFANLHAVVIDEIHAFAADDRGGHLACVLERICRCAGRDVQRIGLSATVGNPATILDWLQGSSERPKRLVDPPRDPAPAELELDFVGTLGNAAIVIEKLHPGRKRLVFADSRKKVETLGRALDERGVRTFVMHSSLSMAERSLAEREFAEGKNCVIVATSAMELGIDVGDLDHVLQIDSPRTVASFLQRMGRTGRRADTTPNCTFLCTKPDQLLQAAAIIELHRRGFVEPIEPIAWGVHLLAHQTLALALQEDGLLPGDLDRWLDGAASIRAISAEDRAELLDHLREEALLAEIDGRVCFGPRAEQLYGKLNFLELYAVFETSRDFKVFHGRNEIGELSPLWVAQKGRLGTEFTLGGKPWVIRAVDHQRRRIDVVRGKQGGAIGWTGRPLALGFELCQQIGAVLRSEDRPAEWTDRAAAELGNQRAAFADVPDDAIEHYAGDYRWHTFAGAAANTILARVIEDDIGATVRFDNFSIDVPRTGGAVTSDTLGAIHRVARHVLELDATELERIGASLDAQLLGKFAPCLPPRAQTRLLAQRYLDLRGARSVARQRGV